MENAGVKERLIQYLTYKGVSVSRFEKACGLSNGYVNSIRTSIQPDKLTAIAQAFPDLNIAWLMIGDANGEEMLRGWLSECDKALVLDDNYTIPLVPMDAAAGFGTFTYEDQRIEEYYNVREFAGSSFLLRVKGDSMQPRFLSGDIVACKVVEVSDMLFFQWGRVYAICTKSQGVMIKRIQPSADSDCIRCVSDNEKYAPFDVPKSDILALALVNGSISME